MKRKQPKQLAYMRLLIAILRVGAVMLLACASVQAHDWSKSAREGLVDFYKACPDNKASTDSGCSQRAADLKERLTYYIKRVLLNYGLYEACSDGPRKNEKECAKIREENTQEQRWVLHQIDCIGRVDSACADKLK